MKVKICGITDEKALDAAAQAGADFIGLVFYPPSPRFLTAEAAAGLAARISKNMKAVGLFVDADDQEIDDILSRVPLGMIQLHGDETPDRVAAIRNKTGMPVIKALRVSVAADVARAAEYEDVADWLLFDAKADSAPGGTGRSFDWALLRDFQRSRPWMLSGGLSAANIAAALMTLKPSAVDVSSGVEDSPGIKNPLKIKDFIRVARE